MDRQYIVQLMEEAVAEKKIQIDTEKNFYEQGIHSLLYVKMLVYLENYLKIQMPEECLIDSKFPTVNAFLDYIDKLGLL